MLVIDPFNGPLFPIMNLVILCVRNYEVFPLCANVPWFLISCNEKSRMGDNGYLTIWERYDSKSLPFANLLSVGGEHPFTRPVFFSLTPSPPMIINVLD